MQNTNHSFPLLPQNIHIVTGDSRRVRNAEVPRAVLADIKPELQSGVPLRHRRHLEVHAVLVPHLQRRVLRRCRAHGQSDTQEPAAEHNDTAGVRHVRRHTRVYCRHSDGVPHWRHLQLRSVRDVDVDPDLLRDNADPLRGGKELLDRGIYNVRETTQRETRQRRGSKLPTSISRDHYQPRDTHSHPDTTPHPATSCAVISKRGAARSGEHRTERPQGENGSPLCAVACALYNREGSRGITGGYLTASLECYLWIFPSV